MNESFFSLYDMLLEGISASEAVIDSRCGTWWTMVRTESRCGIAMTTPMDQRPPMFDSLEGLSLEKMAQAVKSWNLIEAGCGMAAINAYYNTSKRLAQLNAAEPFERYCTAGLDLQGKRIGVVGHMKMPDFVAQQAAQVLYLERNPKVGDYPDSACDYLLPECDIVLITGATLVNKTLPHLLELCKDSVTILAGPTVPMCPELLRCGIDRLAGLVITDQEGMLRQIEENTGCSPYAMGTPFLLKQEDFA